MAAAMSRGKGRRTKNEINMVPFIDVMLVLLIIFMVTAPMLSPSQIELPTVGQAPQQPDRFVHVVIDKDGAMKVVDGNSSTTNEAAVPARELVGRVRALMPADNANAAAQTPVIISADKAVRYEIVIEAMDSLQRAGFGRVGLSVQPVR
jgi:biopolymer transport protein TolR